MSSNKQQPTKTAHSLKTPYPEPVWPTIPPELESTILEILIPLLAPIGQYRDKHVSVSRGSHGNKRRRKSDKVRQNAVEAALVTEEDEEKVPGEGTQPDIQKYLTVGFNTTVRHLEALSQRKRNSFPADASDDALPGVVAIFASTSVLPPVMIAPLPILAATASRSSEDRDAIRLIALSEVAVSRLADTLKQPRVGILGLSEGGPGTAELCKLIRDKIEPVRVSWIQESMNHRYQPVKVLSEEVVVSQSYSKESKRKRDEN